MQEKNMSKSSTNNKKGINRICWHWTAGYGRPNNEDMQHYHIMIDDKGNLHSGYHKIEDNINCKDGNYAQHCALGNTGTIGMAVCGMAGFNTQAKTSYANLTVSQIEALCKKTADLCKQYGIKVTPETVYTHMEYDSGEHGAHEGKIDIVCIPYLCLYGKEQVANELRRKTQWYLEKLKGE